MKRHWYSIEIAYQKNNRTLFSQSECIGLVSQSDIIRHRTLKQHLVKQLVRNPNIQQFLCNGNFALTVLTYLGKFDGNAPTLRNYATERFGIWATDFFIWSTISKGGL